MCNERNGTTGVALTAEIEWIPDRTGVSTKKQKKNNKAFESREDFRLPRKIERASGGLSQGSAPGAGSAAADTFQPWMVTGDWRKKRVFVVVNGPTLCVFHTRTNKNCTRRVVRKLEEQKSQ